MFWYFNPLLQYSRGSATLQLQSMWPLFSSMLSTTSGKQGMKPFSKTNMLLFSLLSPTFRMLSLSLSLSLRKICKPFQIHQLWSLSFLGIYEIVALSAREISRAFQCYQLWSPLSFLGIYEIPAKSPMHGSPYGRLLRLHIFYWMCLLGWSMSSCNPFSIILFNTNYSSS